MEKKTTISRWRKSRRHHHLAFCAFCASSVVCSFKVVCGYSINVFAWKILHICTSLSSRGEKKWPRDHPSSFITKDEKKTERAFIVPPKMHSFFWSLCLFCVLLSNTQRTTKPLFTPRDGACTQKNTLFRVSLRSKFFFFFKNLAREKRHFFSLSLVSQLSLSLERG